MITHVISYQTVTQTSLNPVRIWTTLAPEVQLIPCIFLTVVAPHIDCKSVKVSAILQWIHLSQATKTNFLSVTQATINSHFFYLAHQYRR